MQNSSNVSAIFLKSLDAIDINSSEADVEQKVVVPLLQLLGYSYGDWKTQATVGKAKLDFLVSASSEFLLPYLVIEVKAPKKAISKSVWQLKTYLRDSGATLGLLTNGTSFCLLYHYNGEIETIAECSKQELNEKFSLIYKLLCKSTCLKFNQIVQNSQQQIHFKFVSAISNLFQNEVMFRLFKKKSNLEQAIPENLEDENSLISDQARKGMIITVFNNKGGVGKTTTTINLAAALNKLGKRVLLIDVDAQANLTMGVGIDPLTDVEEQGKKDVTHLLTEARTLLPNTTIRKTWNDVELDIVPSHIRLSDMESTLIQTVDVDRVLIRKLKNYKKDYDYILIDPPPSFGKVNTIALMAASAILVPTHLSPYPIRALEYVINRAQSVEQSRDEPLPILGIAVSMYDKRSTLLQKQMTSKILQILGNVPGGEMIPLFPEETWIPQLKIVSSTPDKGYPLCSVEFDQSLSYAEKESAKEAFDRYLSLADHLIRTTQDQEQVMDFAKRQKQIIDRLKPKPIHHGQLETFLIAVPNLKLEEITPERRQILKDSLEQEGSNLFPIIVRRTEAYEEEEYEVVHGSDWCLIAKELDFDRVWVWVFDLTDEQAAATKQEMELLLDTPADRSDSNQPANLDQQRLEISIQKLPDKLSRNVREVVPGLLKEQLDSFRQEVKQSLVQEITSEIKQSLVQEITKEVEQLLLRSLPVPRPSGGKSYKRKTKTELESLARERNLEIQPKMLKADLINLLEASDRDSTSE